MATTQYSTLSSGSLRQAQAKESDRVFNRRDVGPYSKSSYRGSDTVPFTKHILPVWEKTGRRRHLIGYHALLNDDTLLVSGSHTTPRLFDQYRDAECALDDAVLDLIEEAATTADMEALPFEPTVREIAEMRAACEGKDAWLHLWS